MIKKSQGISVRAMYGAESKRPLVVMTIQDTAIQLSCQAARKIAGDLLTVAEASEQDAFLMKWLQDTIGTNEQGASRLVIEYREWRIKAHEEYNRDPDHQDEPLMAFIDQVIEDAKLDQHSRNADQKAGYIEALTLIRRSIHR